MNRWWLHAASGFLLTVRVLGASEDAARLAAEREAAEERYRILSSTLAELETSQVNLLSQINQLKTDLRRVSEEARSRPGQDQFVTRTEFDKLVTTVREIDRKREADRREILSQIENLGERLSRSMREATRSSARSEPIRPQPSTEPPPANQEGVYYTVEKGNTLIAIIDAHNAEYKSKGRKTSLKLIQDANPGLEPRTMQIGQKIFIPMVPIDSN